MKTITTKMQRQSQKIVKDLWKEISDSCSSVSKSSRYLGKLAIESNRIDLEKDASVKNSVKPLLCA